MQTLQTILGIGIIVITFLDFFYSTLSGNGFGFLSSFLNRGLNWIIIQKRGRALLDYSGLLHLLVTTLIWLGLLFGGALLIFTAGEDMVINATTHLPASFVERLYFTAYLLSTLGIGDFIPGNETSQVIAGMLSFSGFVLLTTGMTYLLSVVQSLLSKKELSFFIATLGRDVEEMYLFYKKDKNLESLMSDVGSLRQHILRNSSSFLAFPMVNYFLTKNKKAALIVQLARLYEVVIVLKKEWAEGSVQEARLTNLIQAIEHYLALGPPEPRAAEHNEEKLRTLRSFWRKYGYAIEGDPEIDKKFTSSLTFSSWGWESVYELKRDL